MDFDVHKKETKNEEKYGDDALNVAYEFAKQAHNELKDILKAVVLFGSVAKRKENSNDIDILLIADDVSVNFTQELVQTYRVIVEKIVADISPRLHVTSMKFTSFWEYVKQGDPIAVNILRDGYALIDTGFFDPLQHLLRQGRISPSKETMWAYLRRAEQNHVQASNRLIEGMHDLYWASIDASHALLTYLGEVPATPEHVPKMLKLHAVQTDIIPEKYAKLVGKLYRLSKDLSHGKEQSVRPKQFKKYETEVENYVAKVKEIVK